MKPISMINMASSRDSEELKRETKIELYQTREIGSFGWRGWIRWFKKEEALPGENDDCIDGLKMKKKPRRQHDIKMTVEVQNIYIQYLNVWDGYVSTHFDDYWTKGSKKKRLLSQTFQ